MFEFFKKKEQPPKPASPETEAFILGFQKKIDGFLRKYVPGSDTLADLHTVVNADMATRTAYRDALLAMYEATTGEPFRRSTATAQENVEMGSPYGAMYYALQSVDMLKGIPVATESKAEKHVREIKERKPERSLEQDSAFEAQLDRFVESERLAAEFARRPALIDKQTTLHQMVQSLNSLTLDPILWKTLVGRSPNVNENIEAIQDEFQEKLYRALLKRLEQKGKL